jgi:N-acetylmuramoyl-L-alanine amidase
MKRFVSFFMFLMLATQVWAETHTIDFAGVQFEPTVYEIGGRTFYSTDDEEILQLLGRANITVNWSSSGHTLFAFAPGRESYWTVGSKRATVNGEDVEAPGLMIVEDGQRYIEPSGLFYALATKGAETAEGYELVPVITQVAQGDTGYLLRSASKAKPKVYSSGQSTVFSIEGFAWDGAESLVMGDTLFEFVGGADQGAPLEVTVTPPTFYAAVSGGSTLLNETKVDILPDFPGAEYAQDVVLLDIGARESAGKPMLMLEFDRGTKIHYLKDDATGDLTVFIPRGYYEGEAFQSPDWTGVEIASYQTALYPVMEITIPGDSEFGYEFVRIEGQANTIALLKDTGLDELAATGSVETPGWMNVRGTIVIDPGHGGSDPGCVNRALGTREADVTLKICLHLAEILRAEGWNVIMTRETDRDITYAGSPDRMELEARSGIANNIGADLFMSVHCNASVNSASYGSSIHWWKAEDYAFAQALEPVLGHAIGLGQKGLIRNRFVVLRHSEMPSVLVETAFLSNMREGAKLSDPEFQKVIARQLAGGLANYMRGVYAARNQRPSVD